MTRKTVVRAALAAVLLAPAAAHAQARPADAPTAQLRAWREQHEPAIVGELNTLLAIPNNASDSANIRRNAALLIQMFEKRGAAARLLEYPGAPPAVFAELRTPGATRTIVFYAHYDGQPVTQAEWATPAWQPVLRARPNDDGSFGAVKQGPVGGRYDPEDRIYARSASDDKSPIVAMLAALDAMRATSQKASVNLKFFLEGEEEAGSTHPKAMQIGRAHV